MLNAPMPQLSAKLPLRPDPSLRELTLPLPAAQRRFGETARIALAGPEGAPLLVLLGGISANRHPCVGPGGRRGWWADLAGPDGAADPIDHRILGIDFIADESGAAAPTPADQAAVIAAALDLIGARRAQAVIGASYGGMVALALAQEHPDRVERIVILSADAAPHPSATAARELQRRVVRLGLDSGRGEEALGIARGMAMLTYRCPDEFGARFEGGIPGEDPLGTSEPGAYLRARGEAFGAVMSPGRFLSLSASIDRHRSRPERIATPALLIGATSDLLVLPPQMEALHARLAGPAALHLLPSRYGHDMFLKEVGRFSPQIADFLRS